MEQEDPVHLGSMTRSASRDCRRKRTAGHPNTIIQIQSTEIQSTEYNQQMADTISTKLANIVLAEAGGGEVRLGSLWEKDPAAIVFLRHYG
jgi:hypothetical protein